MHVGKQTNAKYLQKISSLLIDSNMIGSDSIGQRKFGRLQVVPDGRSMYLRHEAGPALNNLLENFWNLSPWKDRVTFAEFHNAGAGEIINFLAENNGAPLADLQKRIDDSVSKLCVTGIFYEGCFIIPYEAETFNIGPVQFSNTNLFQDEMLRKGVKFGIDDYIEHLKNHDAVWVAGIKLTDVSPNKGDIISKISIDLALASIQLLFRANHEGMRRLSSLNPLHDIVTFGLCDDGRVLGRLTRNTPGFPYTGPWFTNVLNEKDFLFKSFGERIRVLSNKEKNNLDISWCDALYWFHEGIAESIDAIAVTKLETSLEILLCSESSSGSKSKILKALKFFFSKEENDPINQDTDLTLGDLAKNLVRDRSRILHGTWSTLSEDMRFSRSALTQITQRLLIEFSLKLDEYKKLPNSKDGHNHFFTWLIP